MTKMIIEAQDAVAAVVMDLNQMKAASVVAARVGDKTKAQVVQAEAIEILLRILMKAISAAVTVTAEDRTKAQIVRAEAAVVGMNLNQGKAHSVAAGKTRVQADPEKQAAIDMTQKQKRAISPAAAITGMVEAKVPAAPAEAVPHHQLKKQETQRSL